ncbi:MAG: CheR family methyltransferase [Nitrospiria bacterium]
MSNNADSSLTRNNLLTFRDFIQSRTGLFFPETKFFSIERIIESSYQNSPVSEFDDYILYLHSIPGRNHLKKLISLLTTNETYFFREKSHFDMLENHLLPELIARGNTTSKEISIWCAGCSTGEEPYSIAIQLKRLIRNINEWKIEIIASDIDEHALQKGMEGNYGPWSFRGMERRVIRNSFSKINDRYKINDEFRSLVTFKTHNMISQHPPVPNNTQHTFDIIICRNVTIYFEKKTTTELASKFFNVLREGGYLIVGHAEHSAEIFCMFKTRAFPDAIVYQKEEKDQDPSKSEIPLYSNPPLSEKNKQYPALRDNGHPKSRQSGRKPKDLLTEIINRKPAGPPKPSLTKYVKQRKTSSEESSIFNEAMGYFLKKNYELAIDRFLRIVHINASNARACWMLAHMASNRGYFEEAIAWSNRCIKIDPLFKEAYYTLSIVYLAMKKFDEALRSIKKAVYIDQNFILGHFVMGNIYHLMNRPAQGGKCIQTVKDLLASKTDDEVIFETEHLTVGDLITSLECKARNQ